MLTKGDYIFDDIVTNHYDILGQYEVVMQSYYRQMMREDDTHVIPRAQIKALITVLELSGYSVTKKPTGIPSPNNVHQLKQ